MSEIANHISISLHNLNAFSGLLGASTDKTSEVTEAFGIGIVEDHERASFVVGTLDPHRQPEDYLQFAASRKGAKQWMRFLLESTPQDARTIICAEQSFLQFLLRAHKVVPGDSKSLDPVSLPNESIMAELRPIPNGMVRAYLRILHRSDPGLMETAAFLARVASDPLTYYFLTLTGMAHSAQDIVRYIKDGLPLDMVTGLFPGGFEMFVLGRSKETPKDIDLVEFGIEYFSIVSNNKHLPEPYRTKLALIDICKKNHIRFGYLVQWSSEDIVEETNRERHPRRD